MMDQTSGLNTNSSGRLVSIDAFRGFIMISMLLGTFGLRELRDNPMAGFFYTQLSHADWHGFTFEDVILPAFLFIIGVSMAISTERRRSTGTYTSRLIHAVKRAVILFGLGFMISWANTRSPTLGVGVLQLLAFAYFFAFLFVEMSIKVQAIIFGGLLFLYWFFIFVIPVPEVGRNSYVVYQNLVYHIDMLVLGKATRWGYLYTIITSTAVVVLGSITGKLLLSRTPEKFWKLRLSLGYRLLSWASHSIRQSP